MSILEAALLGFALLMSLRQIMLLSTLAAMQRRIGVVRIKTSFWVHLMVTVGSVVAFVWVITQ